jgi:hypothetical protein
MKKEEKAALDLLLKYSKSTLPSYLHPHYTPVWRLCICYLWTKKNCAYRFVGKGIAGKRLASAPEFRSVESA